LESTRPGRGAFSFEATAWGAVAHVFVFLLIFLGHNEHWDRPQLVRTEQQQHLLPVLDPLGARGACRSGGQAARHGGRPAEAEETAADAGSWRWYLVNSKDLFGDVLDLMFWFEYLYDVALDARAC